VARDVVNERTITVGRVIIAGGVVIERLITVGRVEEAGVVFMERSRTSGRICVGGVAIERSITVGRVEVAGDIVGEGISASGTVKKPAGVAKERINARGGVEAAIGIAKQGPKTGRRILVAGSEVVKRLEPSAGVPDPTGCGSRAPQSLRHCWSRIWRRPCRDPPLAPSVQAQATPKRGQAGSEVAELLF
jgi:hypothetical protein